MQRLQNNEKYEGKYNNNNNNVAPDVEPDLYPFQHCVVSFCFSPLAFYTIGQKNLK